MILANVLFCFSVVTVNLTVHIKELKILHVLYVFIPCTDLKTFYLYCFVFIFTLNFRAIGEKTPKTASKSSHSEMND